MDSAHTPAKNGQSKPTFESEKMNTQILQKGTTFARMAIARALAHGDPSTVHALAASRWGANSAVADLLLKSAVGGGTTTSLSELAGTRQAVVEFLEVVRPMTILGKLAGLRRVPVNTPYVALSTGATAYWTAQGRATPVSATAFDRETMTSLKIAALVVLAKELLESADPMAEDLIRRDLARAVAELSDRSFIDADNGGIAGEMPASVTNAAATIAATTDFADDLAAALDAFAGDLETAAWVMSPKLAAKLGLRAGGRGAAADLGARGGSLAGLPAIVSAACQPSSDGYSITLLDAGSICTVDEGAELALSRQATVEMDSAPTGDTTTPAASTTAMVSLFQTDSVGLIVTRRMNWKLARAGSVVCITGASYEGV
jgi:HK97 family phage major capsid protein